MRHVELVLLEHHTRLAPGVYVIPSPNSGIYFTIGQIQSIRDNGLYAHFDTLEGSKEAINSKLQPVKLYLVKKEKYEPGDWYYFHRDPIQKEGSLRRSNIARIGRVNKELDARIFDAGLSKKIIYKPEQIGLMRSPYDNELVSLGSIMPIDIRMIGKILNNNGECFIEEELIDNKVLINEREQ